MESLNLNRYRIPAVSIAYTDEGYNAEGYATVVDYTHDGERFDAAYGLHTEHRFVESSNRGFYCHGCAYGVRLIGIV